mgnify:CR=1 FL=1
MIIYFTRKETAMSEEFKKALEVSIKEAERGEVIHYESLEDLKKELG